MMDKDKLNKAYDTLRKQIDANKVRDSIDLGISQNQQPTSSLTSNYSSDSDSENHVLVNSEVTDTPVQTATDRLKNVLTNYWSERKKNNNQYENQFFGRIFGKSRAQKEDAIKALEDALDREGEISPEHISTLRDGKLGQAIRTFLRENDSTGILNNEKRVYTIREFVHALNEQQAKLVLLS